MALLEYRGLYTSHVNYFRSVSSNSKISKVARQITVRLVLIFEYYRSDHFWEWELISIFTQHFLSRARHLQSMTCFFLWKSHAHRCVNGVKEEVLTSTNWLTTDDGYRTTSSAPNTEGGAVYKCSDTDCQLSVGVAAYICCRRTVSATQYSAGGL